MMQEIGNLFITQLIWVFTLGSKHTVLSVIFLFFFIKFWDHVSWLKAAALSLFFSIVGLLSFLIPVWLIFVELLPVQFLLPEDTYQGNFDYLNTSLLHAAFLIIVQTILLWIIRHWVAIAPFRTFLAIVCSNLISALLVYKLIW